IQSQNWLMNNFSMYVLDKEDDFDTKQYSFGGLSNVYENIMMDVAGAAEMPVTKLFGRSPAGMNATGESDLQNYYDTIEEKQEAYLRPVIDKLLPILCLSEFGLIPQDLDYKFNPVKRSTETEKAEIASKTTTTVVAAFNSGLVSQKISLTELRQMSDITGLWSNITDDDILKADDTANLPGEGLGDMPSFSLDPNANLSMANHAEAIPKDGPQIFGKDMSSIPNALNFSKPSVGVPTADGDFEESKHPRSENGQFGSKAGETEKVSARGANTFSKGFSEHNLKVHIKSHGKEYPDLTDKEYEQRALDLVQRPVGSDIEGYTNSNGQVIRYDKKNNDFVKGKPGLGIATMFKPKSGMKYFISQKERNK
ncbi:MAG TPA: anti-CBASS Acb1 family protein, partial [Desulfosporosinus sp.]|nr:anti-CBASS Acb1 family protein [Desulfosporosinus sp.]